MNRFTIGKVILLAAGAAAVTAYLKDEKFKASTEKALNDIKDTVVKVGKDVADISKDYIEQISMSSSLKKRMNAARKKQNKRLSVWKKKLKTRTSKH